MEQRSTEWNYARVGKVTASRLADVLAVSKKDGKPLKAREDYLVEIVTERLTGEPIMTPTNYAMQWGIDVEPYARQAYEIYSGNICEDTGFVPHPEIEQVGGSPDGLIGPDGGLEIKCPANSVIHLRTILQGMPEEHMAQVQGNMWVTGRAWWDFVSYDPRMPVHLRLYIKRVERDEQYIKRMNQSVLAFLTEVEAFIESLNKVRMAA